MFTGRSSSPSRGRVAAGFELTTAADGRRIRAQMAATMREQGQVLHAHAQGRDYGLLPQV